MIQRIVATPLWADFKKIKEVYLEADRLTILMGVTYHVDHIIPLNHPMVCGLHVHSNLRPFAEKYNQAKSNYWNPDQLEMEFPKQHKLLI